MVKKYERFTKEDLAIVNPIGNDNLRGLDLIQIPDLTDDTLMPLRTSGGLMHGHIYSGRRTSQMLKGADIAVKRMYFGRVFQGENPADISETHVQERAKYLGRAVVGRSVYIAAYEPADMVNNDNPGYYAGAVVGMVPFPEGGALCVEPVVKSLNGEKGLMPQNFYAFNGLYVPAK